ncbi:hypothetical protein AB0K14_17935 [Actinosynnema sp. NPDC050801]|uniref:hypothetical protein n=1 Tax=unclassified Actinosynnema TaxID=2637065 RepID=UPI0033D6D783
MQRRPLTRPAVLAAALLLATATTTATTTATAGAGTPDHGAPTLLLSPTEVEPGGEITVTAGGMCEAHDQATSPGFAAPIGFQDSAGTRVARGRVITTPGTYTARLDCLWHRQPGYATFTIRLPQLRAFTVSPARVRPGGELTARIPAEHDCTGTTIGSTGFVAPLELRPQGAELVGTARAVAAPGTYQATMQCRDGLFAVGFSVLGDPPANQPPRQPVKKPKGAPDTGGGGTS